MSNIFVRIFVKGRLKGEESMPPNEELEMSASLSKLEAVLHRIETQHELHEEQLKMYRETIDKQIGFYDKRMDANDKRWSALRNTVWTVIGIIFIVVFTGGVSLDGKTSPEDVAEIIMMVDPPSTMDVVHGFNSLIDDTFGEIERNTELTHDESRAASEDAKIKVYKEVTGYSSRSTNK